MDFNPDYPWDIIKWAGLKMFYYQGLLRNPIPYNIHIIWNQESTYRVIHGANKSTGWPVQKIEFSVSPVTQVCLKEEQS